MNVLVGCIVRERLLQLLCYPAQTSVQRTRFIRVEHVGAHERLHPCSAAFNVFTPQTLIDGERTVQLRERWRWSGREPAAPQLVLTTLRHRCRARRYNRLRHRAPTASDGFSATGACPLSCAAW